MAGQANHIVSTVMTPTCFRGILTRLTTPLRALALLDSSFALPFLGEAS
jgi:hypothetical protein